MKVHIYGASLSPSAQGASPSPNPQGMSPIPCPSPSPPDSDSTIESESGLAPEMPHNHKCSYCSKSFITSSRKDAHEIKHREEKHKYLLYKSVSRLGNKKLNELTHTGEKPHKCSKSFVTTTKKRNHEMRHTGEKPHKCSYCSKSFFTKMEKKAHETDIQERNLTNVVTVVNHSLPRRLRILMK